MQQQGQHQDQQEARAGGRCVTGEMGKQRPITAAVWLVVCIVSLANQISILGGECKHIMDAVFLNNKNEGQRKAGPARNP